MGSRADYRPSRSIIGSRGISDARRAPHRLPSGTLRAHFSAHRIDHARELDGHPVASDPHDAAVVLGDLRVEQLQRPAEFCGSTLRSSFQAVPYMISGTAALRKSKVLAVRMRASTLRVRLVSKKNWLASPQSAASAAVAGAKVSQIASLATLLSLRPLDSRRS